jgi:hypothetical protein
VKVDVDQLVLIIGQMQVETFFLRAELAQVKAKLKELEPESNGSSADAIPDTAIAAAAR